MIINDRIDSFEKLGLKLKQIESISKFNSILKITLENNKWFTEQSIRNSFRSVSLMLEKDKIRNWLKDYKFNNSEFKIGVIIPSNVPLVGFFDFLCVLISGNKFIGNLSSQNNILLPFISKILIDIEPRFRRLIRFESEFKKIDLLIASGDDNSYEFFNFKFRSIPRIVRSSRNSVSVIDGNENDCELDLLNKDLFLYFGLGCRNVSKIFIPKGYDIKKLIERIKNYNFSSCKNYSDNYLFQKTVCHLSKIKYYDLGHSILVKSNSFFPPISVIYFDIYDDISEVENFITNNDEMIQCVVSNLKISKRTIFFGQSQLPSLFDYPDGVDVLKFIESNLSNKIQNNQGQD